MYYILLCARTVLRPESKVTKLLTMTDKSVNWQRPEL